MEKNKSTPTKFNFGNNEWSHKFSADKKLGKQNSEEKGHGLNQTRNIYTGLYTNMNQVAKKKEDKQSPFKKAGDYFIRRMRNMSGSGDFMEGSDHSEG
jgi:hypothetical protein